MATRLFTRSLLTSKLTLSSVLSRSYTSLRPSAPPSSLTTSSVLRLRPLVAVAAHFHRLTPAGNSIRGFATRQTSTSLNDPNPNWSNRPPKETILLDGCDFEHWLVVLEKPEDDPTRDEIIDSYIKTLAAVVGSEEEARKKIYSVSTRHYYAFGALVSEELSYKLKEIPKVRWVLPDSYLDVRNKDYGGEPFIDGQALPYDPKYHEEWVRNNARAQERNRRNDRPRNFDRSRNFERRRENIQNRDHQMQNPGSNMGGPPQQTNMGGPPQQTNMGSANNMGGQPPMNMGRAPNVEAPPPGYIGNMPQNNRVGAPNMGNMPQNNMGQMPQNSMRGPPNMAGSPNMGGGSNMGGNPNFGGRGGGPGPNMGGMPTNNMAGNASNLQYGNGPNMGGMPTNNVAGNASDLQYGNGPNMGGMPTNNMAGNASNLQYGNGPNRGGMPFQNRDMSGQGQNREYQHGYDAYNAAGENPYQNQNISGRDMPPSPGY